MSQHIIKSSLKAILQRYTAYIPTNRKPRPELSEGALQSMQEVLAEYGLKITKTTSK